MHIKHQLDQLATGLNKFNQLATGEQTTKLTKSEVLGCDIALSMYTDLMEPRFFKWYCKVFYKIGRERFAQLASEARADGKIPAKLFSTLLAKELRYKNQGGAQGGAPAPL